MKTRHGGALQGCWVRAANSQVNTWRGAASPAVGGRADAIFSSRVTALPLFTAAMEASSTSLWRRHNTFRAICV